MNQELGYPQPVGIFEFPDGLLLVPGGESNEPVRQQLLVGKRADLPVASGAVGRYNAWVLDPDSDDPAQVRAGLPEPVRPLVDLVSYIIGRGEVPLPNPGSRPEVAALILAAQSADAVERGDLPGAAMTLQQAVSTAAASPTLAAVLRATALTSDLQPSEPGEASADLAAVLADLDATDLVTMRAELRLRLGTLAQEAAVAQPDPTAGLRSAMSHYYDGLQLVSEQSAPVLWALLNLNLATAQLAVPMSTASDQLRLGVATMSLRAARRVLGEHQQLPEWSIATLNLANALVYTPSTHQGDNMVEAVNLYQEVLASGVRDADPLGRARLLANLGNVLAHMGVYDEARPYLVEARYVFEEHLDHDGATAVRSVLDEIAKTEVTTADADLSELTRRAEQMSKVPVADDRTAGMNVTMLAPDTQSLPRTVTVMDPATRPTGAPGHPEQA